jgi:hypothetical protein
MNFMAFWGKKIPPLAPEGNRDCHDGILDRQSDKWFISWNDILHVGEWFHSHLRAYECPPFGIWQLLYFFSLNWICNHKKI